MFSFAALFAASYYGLYKYMPLLNQDNCVDDYGAQFVRYVIILQLSYALANAVWRQRFIPKMRISASDKLAVFITGCDTGFGNRLARKLDAAGFSVYAGCLFASSKNAQQLQAQCSQRLRVVQLDVTSDEQCERAYDFVSEQLDRSQQQLLALVNNAGILEFGEFELGNMRPFERQMQVNALGTIRVTKVFSPLLRRCATSPRLVNVTSLAARISLPGMVGYCASKYAALGFTDGARSELVKWGVKVVSVEPHLFNTNLIAQEQQSKAFELLWQQSRQVTRDDYGDEFFRGGAALMNRAISSARTNIDDVVQALYDSVTVRYPELHRVVCSSELERLRCWFGLNVIPGNLRDFLLHFGTAWVVGKPTRLDQIKSSSGTNRNALIATKKNKVSQNNNNNSTGEETDASEASGIAQRRRRVRGAA